MQTAAVGRDLLWQLQNTVIQLIAEDSPLTVVARAICLAAESVAQGNACSILKVKDGRLHHLAGPSLPGSYAAATTGLEIGPSVGSCGTAAYRNAPVLTEDIFADPLWSDYQTLARQLPYRACWSSPVVSGTGEVVATFAFYFDEARGPTEWEREVVCRCSQLIAVATQYESARRLLDWQAHHDPLSGLSNRRAFHRILGELIHQESPFGLVLLDLDDLKGMNDRLGHAAGDAVIRELGKRLHIWAADFAFRLGGDEFAVIAKGCATDEQLSLLAHQILGSLKGPVRLDANTIHMVTTAGGILGGSYRDADTLLQNADFALYHAKEVNRGGFVPFEAQLRTTMTARQNMLAQVDEALRDGRIVPYYQPIVRLHGAEICGFEALARMVLKDGNVVAAGQFSDAFFDPRLSREIADAMLREVSAHLGKWTRDDPPVAYVGLNVTTADFQRGDLSTRIEAALRCHDVPNRHLVIEINEAVYLGKSDLNIANQVCELREAGFLVALDDFGTGYASLAHLLQFPVDFIKLDKTLVSAAAHQSDAAIAIISGIMEISRKLDMGVVAEGIESVGEAELLHSLGCAYGQGYLYAAALPFGHARRMHQTFGRVGLRHNPNAAPDAAAAEINLR